jgi:surfeit locus 1 family protein
MTARPLRLVAFGVVTLLAVALCVRLGIWQLDRLAQRRAQNAIVTARGTLPVVDVQGIRTMDTTASHWRRVSIIGVAEYDRELVHGMRTQNGSPGVHLLTPIRPLGGAWGDTAVLVIRGYLHAPDGRTVDHAAVTEGDTVRLETLVLSYPATQATSAVRMPSNARAVRTLDRDTLATMIGRPLAPFVLLALGDTVVRDISKPARIPPPAVNEGPHLSYALQWFGFATVFLIGFVIFARRQPRSRPQ